MFFYATEGHIFPLNEAKERHGTWLLHRFCLFFSGLAYDNPQSKTMLFFPTHFFWTNANLVTWKPTWKEKGKWRHVVGKESILAYYLRGLATATADTTTTAAFLVNRVIRYLWTCSSRRNAFLPLPYLPSIPTTDMSKKLKDRLGDPAF